MLPENVEQAKLCKAFQNDTRIRVFTTTEQFQNIRSR